MVVSRFSISPLHTRGSEVTEQETAWVCRTTGQESLDKGKETQMEALALKLSHIPKTWKTNINHQGL